MQSYKIKLGLRGGDFGENLDPTAVKFDKKFDPTQGFLKCRVGNQGTTQCYKVTNPGLKCYKCLQKCLKMKCLNPILYFDINSIKSERVRLVKYISIQKNRINSFFIQVGIEI